MSRLALHAPELLWAGLAVVPLVALWFLRLRRPELKVPSLALWRLALEDRRADSLFQRLKRHLQLLLQLLALAALVLAAAQPALATSARASERVAVLVDVSASMAARDRPAAPSRLEAARKLARSAVAAAGSGREVCLLSFDREARRLVPFSDDPRRLARAVDALEPVCTGSNPAAALRLLRTIGRSEPFARAVLITDGVLPSTVDEDLACTLEVVRIAPAGANLGITAFSARRRADGAWDVAVSVTAAEEPSAGAVLRLLAGPTELFSRPVAPAPLATESVLVRVSGGPLELVARLDPRGDDALALDDEAHLPLPAADPATAWVSPHLPRWRQALAAQPALRLSDTPDGCELLVSDAAADLERPARVRLGIGHVPRDLLGLVSIADDDRGSRVVDARRSNPLLAHLALDDIAIAQRVAYVGGAGERELEARGWTAVVHGDSGPLLIERQRPDGCDWALLPHSERTDLPYRLAFPVMCGNLALAALQAAGRSEAVALPTGLLPPLHTGPGPVRIDGPGGGSEVSPDADGMVVGLNALQPGIWHLRGREGAIAVGTGLLDAMETRLQPAGNLRARDVAVAEGRDIAGELPLWPWLLATALLLLLAEWWLANRPPTLKGTR